jgi:hypothetical protein
VPHMIDEQALIIAVNNANYARFFCAKRGEEVETNPVGWSTAPSCFATKVSFANDAATSPRRWDGAVLHPTSLRPPAHRAIYAT